MSNNEEEKGTMSSNEEEKAYFIQGTSNNGLVLAYKSDGKPTGVVMQTAMENDAKQRWVFEKGDGPDIFAIKCCENGQYLHANGPDRRDTTVGTGEKQMWRVHRDDVSVLNAWRLTPVDFPSIMLNHYQGKRVENMNVHMWNWEKAPWEFCLTWYIVETVAMTPTLPGGPRSDGDASAKKVARRVVGGVATPKEGKRYYVSSCSGGYVLAHKPDKSPSPTVLQIPDSEDNDKSQQWQVEYGENDTVALRCCSNDEYLRALGGTAWKQVETGEKMWWKLARGADVVAPTSFSLQPVEFPTVFLNHHGPAQQNNATVHMWTWRKECYNLTWNFTEVGDGTTPIGNGTQEATAPVDDTKANDLEAKAKELDEREAAVAKREQEAAKAPDHRHDFNDEEETSTTSNQNGHTITRTSKSSNGNGWTTTESNFDDFGDHGFGEARKNGMGHITHSGGASGETSELSGQKEENDSKVKELEEREAAVAKREIDASAGGVANAARKEELEKREAALAEKEQAALSEKDTDATRKRKLDEQEAALAKRESDASLVKATDAQKSKDLTQREAATAQKERDLVSREAKQKTLEKQNKVLQAKAAEQATADSKSSADNSRQQAELQTELQNKFDDLHTAELDLAVKQAAAEKQRRQNMKKEEELKQKVDVLAKQIGNALLQSEDEKLQFRLEMAQLKKHLDAAKRYRPNQHGPTCGNHEKLAELGDENARLKEFLVKQDGLCNCKCHSNNGTGTSEDDKPAQAEAPQSMAGSSGASQPQSKPQPSGTASPAKGRNPSGPPKLGAKPASNVAQQATKETASPQQQITSQPTSTASLSGGQAPIAPSAPSSKPTLARPAPGSDNGSRQTSTRPPKLHSSAGSKPPKITASGATPSKDIVKGSTAPPRQVSFEPETISKPVANPTSTTPPLGAAAFTPQTKDFAKNKLPQAAAGPASAAKPKPKPNVPKAPSEAPAVGNDEEITKLRKENQRLRDAARQSQANEKPTAASTKPLSGAQPLQITTKPLFPLRPTQANDKPTAPATKPAQPMPFTTKPLFPLRPTQANDKSSAAATKPGSGVTPATKQPAQAKGKPSTAATKPVGAVTPVTKPDDDVQSTQANSKPSKAPSTTPAAKPASGAQPAQSNAKPSKPALKKPVNDTQSTQAGSKKPATPASAPASYQPSDAGTHDHANDNKGHPEHEPHRCSCGHVVYHTPAPRKLERKLIGRVYG